MIFGVSLIICLIAATVLWYWRKWDLRYIGIYLAFAGGLALASSTISYFIGTSQDYYAEVWNYKVVEARYFESWDERVSCRHPVYREVKHKHTRTNSKGKSETYYTTERVIDHYQHSYDVDWHNPYWEAVDEYGSTFAISESEYHRWKNIWNGDRFIDLHRHFHSKDGDEYVTNWNGSFDTIWPKEHVSQYENKIRISNSLFNYATVDDATRDKYFRPADKGNTGGIISYDGTPFSESENLLIRRVNAYLGKNYKVHNIVILWDGTKTPRSEMETVVTAWRGPNKNELVTAIGVDADRNIIWCDCWSWMEDTTVHAMIRNDLLAMKRLDFGKFKTVLMDRIPEKWVKRNFHDFDYIHNPLPTACYVVVYIIVLLGVVGIAIIMERTNDDLTSWEGKPRRPLYTLS